MIVQVMFAGLEPGARVRAVQMPGDPDPVAPGTTGTVTRVTSGPFMQVTVDWEGGRRLMLVAEDLIEVLS